MTDYDALVKALREHRGWALNETLDAAADAIEELQAGEKKFLRLYEESDYVRCTCTDAARAINEMRERLSAYEDAEEQGRLVIVPCKVGDMVYRIHTKDHVEKHRVIAFHVSASGLWFWDENGRETPVDKIGKTVFLTRAEAEAAIPRAYDRDQYDRGYHDGRMFRPAIVTNADRIRAMTDEELASYLTGVWYSFEEMPGMCDVCDKQSVQNCSDCWLDWLKQEATDEV